MVSDEKVRKGEIEIVKFFKEKDADIECTPKWHMDKDSLKVMLTHAKKPNAKPHIFYADDNLFRFEDCHQYDLPRLLNKEYRIYSNKLKTQ